MKTMSKDLFDALRDRGFITDEKCDAIHRWYDHPKVNLYLELRSLLYLGVILFAGGLSLFIYTHIEQLGHLTIISALIALYLGCLVWSAKVAKPFSWQKVESPNTAYDYVLLLAALLVPIIIAYLQSQFNFFGNRWSLASFIPMLILFGMAYFFDHQGVLSLAISSLAAWLGITIKPSLLLDFDLFNHHELIITCFALGVALLAFATFIKTTRFKPHFNDTYQQFGTHLAFLGALAALVEFTQTWALWLLVIFALGAWHLYQAFHRKNSYLMMVAILYMYIGTCYVVSGKILAHLDGENEIYANLFYYLFSGIGVGMLINRLHKKFKTL